MNDKVTAPNGLDVFHRQDNESVEVWIARLQSVNWDTLTMLQRIALSHSKDLARKAIKGEAPIPEQSAPAGGPASVEPGTALRQTKDAYLSLSKQQREQFALWMANGAQAE